MPDNPAIGPTVDAHTHIFCWGENPSDGYLSERTRRAWLTRLVIWLTGLQRESGNTISEKMRSRLLRHANESALDYIVVLAQDAVYRPDGTRDDAATHFYVSNKYVFDLARDCPKILPGCSINPLRADALRELERCREAGARLCKVHTAIQGVDPSRPELDPFYKLAKDLGVVLMFHTGYEHSCTVVSQKFTNPPARLPYLFRTGMFPAGRRNPLDLDFRIKTSFDLGAGYGGQLLKLMGAARENSQNDGGRMIK